jgi:hypothetical protein
MTQFILSRNDYMATIDISPKYTTAFPRPSRQSKHSPQPRSRQKTIFRRLCRFKFLMAQLIEYYFFTRH